MHFLRHFQIPHHSKTAACSLLSISTTHCWCPDESIGCQVNLEAYAIGSYSLSIKRDLHQQAAISPSCHSGKDRLWKSKICNFKPKKWASNKSNNSTPRVQYHPVKHNNIYTSMFWNRMNPLFTLGEDSISYWDFNNRIILVSSPREPRFPCANIFCVFFFRPTPFSFRQLVLHAR
jgi:hypothetical protein